MRQKNKTRPQLLLLEDVVNLGRKGDLVVAKRGFVRNFLLPQKKAMIADKRTIRMRVHLQEERRQQTVVDKQESQRIAHELKDQLIETFVKVDKQGHLYGSIHPALIVDLLKEKKGLDIGRKQVIISHPIKSVGTYIIELKLKEDVSASFKLKVSSDIPLEEPKTAAVVIKEEEEVLEEEIQEEVGSEGEELPLKSERKKQIKEELEQRSKE